MTRPKCRGICHQPEKHGYVIHYVAGKEHSITCFCCGMLSPHPMDVLHRYCPLCHIFHDVMLSHSDGMVQLLRQLLRCPTDPEEELIDNVNTSETPKIRERR